MDWDEEVQWCRSHWELINDRGVWGIPRSGLVLQKQKEERRFLVIERMPHERGMTVTAEQWRSVQDSDIEAIRTRFEPLGITIEEKP